MKKLYHFRHSPFARKVQAVLDLMHADYQRVAVAYGERNELAELTGGYIYVPVLVDDDGSVTIESRDICKRLVAKKEGAFLVPSPLEGPIWGYSDFCDGPLEDITFRIASPETRKQWPSASDRALYTMNKERKFGAGCIDQWEREREQLCARAQSFLEPSFSTLSKRPFLFGDTPSLADAALYGQTCMLREGAPALVAQLSPVLAEHGQRLEEWISKA